MTRTPLRLLSATFSKAYSYRDATFQVIVNMFSVILLRTTSQVHCAERTDLHDVHALHLVGLTNVFWFGACRKRGKNEWWARIGYRRRATKVKRSPKRNTLAERIGSPYSSMQHWRKSKRPPLLEFICIPSIVCMRARALIYRPNFFSRDFGRRFIFFTVTAALWIKSVPLFMNISVYSLLKYFSITGAILRIPRDAVYINSSLIGLCYASKIKKSTWLSFIVPCCIPCISMAWQAK